MGRVERVKRHFKENYPLYLVGVGCAGVGYMLHQPTVIITKDIDSVSVLFAMGDDKQLTHEIISGLAEGTFDEWDCDLCTALEEFGPLELSRAAHAGAFYIQSMKEVGVE
jgi:hypothetical protein